MQQNTAASHAALRSHRCPQQCGCSAGGVRGLSRSPALPVAPAASCASSASAVLPRLHHLLDLPPPPVLPPPPARVVLRFRHRLLLLRRPCLSCSTRWQQQQSANCSRPTCTFCLSAIKREMETVPESLLQHQAMTTAAAPAGGLLPAVTWYASCPSVPLRLPALAAADSFRSTRSSSSLSRSLSACSAVHAYQPASVHALHPASSSTEPPPLLSLLLSFSPVTTLSFQRGEAAYLAEQAKLLPPLQPASSSSSSSTPRKEQEQQAAVCLSDA